MASASRRQDTPTVKRQAIERDVLRATETLLAEGATYAELAVERIATEAGLSRTAFYFYFKDKRDLLTRLTEDVAAQLYEVADEWFTGDVELPEALKRCTEVFLEHGPLLRAVIETSGYDPEIGGLWRSLIGRFVEATRVRIEEERREGRAPAGADAGATAFGLVWMLERVLYEQIVLGGPIDRGDLDEAVLRIWSQTIYGS